MSIRSERRHHRALPHRRVAAAVLAGLATFGAVGASAASLGGITAQSLGADVSVIASCDTDGVTLATTSTYDVTSGAYKVSSVAIGGIATACNGKAISVTLKDASGTSLGTGSGTVATGAATIAMSPTADAKTAVGAAVVISG